MINFSKVRYKNFLSTGQQFIEVDLQKSNTTLVVGENGAGKSTMLDALCFGLFQRAFRNIKKDQMINTINEKECIVEVEFTVGQKDYKINKCITKVYWANMPNHYLTIFINNKCLWNTSYTHLNSKETIFINSYKIIRISLLS